MLATSTARLLPVSQARWCVRNKRLLVLGDSNGGHNMRAYAKLFGLKKVFESNSSSAFGISSEKVHEEHNLLFERYESPDDAGIVLEFVRLYFANNMQLTTDAGGTIDSILAGMSSFEYPELHTDGVHLHGYHDAFYNAVRDIVLYSFC